MSGESMGWVSVNHEMVVSDDKIGDGGGMTVFRIKRDETTDSIIVMDQTLSDGRAGKFFNVDFVNHTGETGMNCGGISSMDGRVWTAEEWWRNDNGSIEDRDKSDFVIGTGTVNGQAAPAGFPGFDGETIAKFENYNYMTEIDPKEAVAIRKQYNWGRQPFEGGAILADNKTVFLGVDDTPGYFTKFVANTAGDFTSGKTYVFKQDGTSSKWVEIDNTDLNNMLNFKDVATAAGATMFNRLEWIVYSTQTGKVYIAETGRDKPGSAWMGEHAAGATHAAHHTARATAQGTHPDSAAYWDYYGRVLEFNPTSDEMNVLIEGGPYAPASQGSSAYPSVHLSNPDGLGLINIHGQDYLLVQEDINGLSYNRVPSGVSHAICEVYLLDLSVASPTYDDLKRIIVTPIGAEVTGATGTPDGKTILVNVQHPSTNNPYPNNHSHTLAITGWDNLASGVLENPSFSATEEFQVYPNPATRFIYLNKNMDVALYDTTGQRINVYRNVNQIDISGLSQGTYFVRSESGATKKVIIQ
jgi:hypothetical protein